MTVWCATGPTLCNGKGPHPFPCCFDALHPSSISPGAPGLTSCACVSYLGAYRLLPHWAHARVPTWTGHLCGTENVAVLCLHCTGRVWDPVHTLSTTLCLSLCRKHTLSPQKGTTHYPSIAAQCDGVTLAHPRTLLSQAGQVQHCKPGWCGVTGRNSKSQLPARAAVPQHLAAASSFSSSCCCCSYGARFSWTHTPARIVANAQKRC